VKLEVEVKCVGEIEGGGGGAFMVFTFIIS
jgi:hypothetical protein